MHTKLVLRLLDAFDRLLGWTEVRALAKGDGALWATHPVTIWIERDGFPSVLSIHWADVNVETRVPCAHDALGVGSTLNLPAYDSGPVLKVGEMPTRLAPVTVRATVAVGVPVGGVGVRV